MHDGREDVDVNSDLLWRADSSSEWRNHIILFSLWEFDVNGGEIGRTSGADALLRAVDEFISYMNWHHSPINRLCKSENLIGFMGLVHKSKCPNSRR